MKDDEERSYESGNLHALISKKKNKNKREKNYIDYKLTIQAFQSH